VLASRGAQPGDAVGIYLPSNLELALSYWGAQLIRAVPVPLNPMFRSTEVAAAVAITRMRVVVTDPRGEQELRRGSDTPPEAVLVWAADRADSVEALVRASPEPVATARRGPRDAASMFFTSGTTGRPKVVVQTELGHQSSLTAMFAHNGLRYGSEVVLNVMPMFNNFGASGVMNLSVFAGATMVLLERWDCASALDLITEHGVTVLLGTPTIYVDICEQFDSDRHDLSSVRTAVVAGAPAAPSLIERFQKITGTVLSQVYGATETAGIVTGERRGAPVRAGSIGQVAGSAVVKVLDDDGHPVRPGEPGEIVVSGDIVSPGYFEDPEAQAAFTAEGWHSGDVGYVDADGYYYLVDRQKDLIICAGNNVYPAEVEAAIMSHSAVALCSVVGAPDERRGEIPVAVVVLSGGAHATAEEVIAHCRDRLAAYKAPREVQFAEALPLGPTGKVLKEQLREDVLRRRGLPEE
jgi:acyl-CoA synthetase (AMP-forming)/AMP-acid ligase II